MKKFSKKKDHHQASAQLLAARTTKVEMINRFLLISIGLSITLRSNRKIWLLSAFRSSNKRRRMLRNYQPKNKNSRCNKRTLMLVQWSTLHKKSNNNLLNSNSLSNNLERSGVLYKKRVRAAVPWPPRQTPVPNAAVPPNGQESTNKKATKTQKVAPDHASPAAVQTVTTHLRP